MGVPCGGPVTCFQYVMHIHILRFDALSVNRGCIHVYICTYVCTVHVHLCIHVRTVGRISKMGSLALSLSSLSHTSLIPLSYLSTHITDTPLFAQWGGSVTWFQFRSEMKDRGFSPADLGVLVYVCARRRGSGGCGCSWEEILLWETYKDVGIHVFWL